MTSFLLISTGSKIANTASDHPSIHPSIHAYSQLLVRIFTLLEQLAASVSVHDIARSPRERDPG
jgi:hypothetical protein